VFPQWVEAAAATVRPQLNAARRICSFDEVVGGRAETTG
jgi:hypothetical protein